jgi:hypothetical protein
LSLPVIIPSQFCLLLRFLFSVECYCNTAAEAAAVDPVRQQQLLRPMDPVNPVLEGGGAVAEQQAMNADAAQASAQAAQASAETVEQLPPPTAQEIADLNALLNSQRTYNESADILQARLEELLEAGHIHRAVGFVRGEAVLIVYMRDNMLIEFMEKYLAVATPFNVRRFLTLAPLVQSSTKVDNLILQHFDRALAKNETASC